MKWDNMNSYTLRIISGYLHQIENALPNSLKIPQDIIDLCISFYVRLYINIDPNSIYYENGLLKHIATHAQWKNIYELGKEISMKFLNAKVYRTRCVNSERYKFVTHVYSNCSRCMILRIIRQMMVLVNRKFIKFFDVAYGVKGEDQIYLTAEAFKFSLKQGIDIRNEQLLIDAQKQKVHEKDEEKSSEEKTEITTGKGDAPYSVENKDELKYFFVEVAAFLNRLHELGYAHLNVKPTNIWFRFTKKSRNVFLGNGWKVVDGILIRWILKGSDYQCDYGYKNDQTYIQQVNHEYAAPEIKNDVITAKADVWSLAKIVLYWINHGQCKTLKESEGLVNKIDTQLYDLLSKMLVPHPNDRISMRKVIGHPYFALEKMRSEYIMMTPSSRVYGDERPVTRLMTLTNVMDRYMQAQPSQIKISFKF